MTLKSIYSFLLREKSKNKQKTKKEKEREEIKVALNKQSNSEMDLIVYLRKEAKRKFNKNVLR